MAGKINGDEDSRFEQLAQAMAAHPKSETDDGAIYICLAESFLYETTTGSPAFMRHEPLHLYGYNQEFATPTTQIIPGVVGRGLFPRAGPVN